MQLKQDIHLNSANHSVLARAAFRLLRVTELKCAILKWQHATPVASAEPVNAELNQPLSSKRATCLTPETLTS